MKHLGNLLLTVSLITAMLSAATSYLVFLERATPATFEEEHGVARLKAPAGRVDTGQARRAELDAQLTAGEIGAEDYVAARRASEALLAPDVEEGGTRMTSERLNTLREAGVESVFVKSFSFERWRHGWLFLVAALGLLAGSLMVRTAAKREIEAASAKAKSDGDGVTPDAALEALARLPQELGQRLAGTADEAERLSLILEGVGEAQRLYVEPFVDGRPLFVSRLGLGGYAELMDRFAGGERQLNRAWSAAADGVLHEAETCLRTAGERLEEARARLATG